MKPELDADREQIRAYIAGERARVLDEWFFELYAHPRSSCEMLSTLEGELGDEHAIHLRLFNGTVDREMKK